MARKEAYCQKCGGLMQDCECRHPRITTRDIVDEPGLSAGAQAEKDAWATRRNPLFTGLAPDQKRDNRIEALRAASQIVAGDMVSGQFQEWAKALPTADGPTVVTLNLAEQFARWLETGER